MRAFICAALLLVAASVSVPFAGTAFAQAGSTGGTLGNTDKSISGEREEPRQPAEPRRRHAEPGAKAAMPAGIHVTSATFGQNCGVPRGNVTEQVAALCNGKESCSLPGSQVNNPDPAFGCNKGFAAEWQRGGVRHANAVPPSFNATAVLTLSCK
jgi:hypothetical protein